MSKKLTAATVGGATLAALLLANVVIVLASVLLGVVQGHFGLHAPDWAYFLGIWAGRLAFPGLANTSRAA